MNQFFGYIRVSTVRQGEHGVSLAQQREAIERFCQRQNLKICRWFEEQETAARRGRPMFGQMLKLLKAGRASGVVIHKIDRSARNLKDWADLGELIDAGIEVHFANESLDLHSRGGRLSADIQAVVAADYIRNLREETMKGFYGRLRQGVYPRPAPLGYTDRGAGQPKAIDPIAGPLIRQAFELYGTGRYNLERLAKDIHGAGLRTKAGGAVSISVLSRILNNSFYTGLIRIAKTGETFDGSHEPLVPLTLFRRVQDLLRGKVNRRSQKHLFLFRQLWMCGYCGRHLIGESQKGAVYYRCHTNGCSTRTVREEALERAIITVLRRLELTQEEKDAARQRIAAMSGGWMRQRESMTAALRLKVTQAGERLARLTDAYLDQAIDRQTFEERKTALLEERRITEEQVSSLNAGAPSVPDQLSEIVELAGRAYLAYKHALPEEKRDLLKTVSSNRTLSGKSLSVTPNIPFRLIAERFSVPCGRPPHDTGRDVSVLWDNLLGQLTSLVEAQQAAVQQS